MSELTDSKICQTFILNGFTVKEGQSDLKPYVYAAARAIIADDRAQRQAGQEPVAWMRKGDGELVSVSSAENFYNEAEKETMLTPLYTVPQPAAQPVQPDHVARELAAAHTQNSESIANGWKSAQPVQPAAQPAVERKPLTDEQIDEIRIVQEFWQWDVGTGVFRHVARAIEQAHGIAPTTQGATQ